MHSIETDKETDSDLPRNLKQITHKKSSICNISKIENKIEGYIAYLLEQPNETIKSDLSSNDKPFYAKNSVSKRKTITLHLIYGAAFKRYSKVLHKWINSDKFS